jgi:hypothetical protein
MRRPYPPHHVRSADGAARRPWRRPDYADFCGDEIRWTVMA